MAKNSKKQHLEYLLRNKENIVRNYLTVDDTLLNAIADENMDKFIQIAGENSSDNFLVNILPEYTDFTTELFEIVKNENISLIEKIKIEKKEARKLPVRPVVKRKVPIAPTIDKPQQLRPRKNNRMKWSKKEESRIKILLKAGKKPKEINIKLNETRLKDEKVLRTNSSINNKIYRIKKQNRKVKK